MKTSSPLLESSEEFGGPLSAYCVQTQNGRTPFTGKLGYEQAENLARLMKGHDV
jgi:hypothetical protein